MEKIGIVLGKFYPLHIGHIHLIKEASKQVEQLIILLGSLSKESIDGKLRYEWLKKEFPFHRIHHIEEENPQYPEEHPDFWNIWKNSIKKFVPENIGIVFTSETYGEPLAKILGARHICIDLERKTFPISGNKIRENPFKYWNFLAESAKPYFVKKIVLYGPESTGKTTLSAKLAEYFQTEWIPEFARNYLEEKNLPVEESDIPIIAKGQIELEEKAILKANKILFCDTDVLVTKVYSEHYYGTCPTWVKEIAVNRNYAQYFLTNNDIPHVADKLRDRADRREEMYELFKLNLIQSNKPFKEIFGNFENRFKLAIQYTKEILENPNLF